MRDQPPELRHLPEDSHQLPHQDDAADRVNAFLSEYGDGKILTVHRRPLYARDLQALTNFVRDMKLEAATKQAVNITKEFGFVAADFTKPMSGNIFDDEQNAVDAMISRNAIVAEHTPSPATATPNYRLVTRHVSKWEDA